MGEFGLRNTALDIHNCIKSNRKNRRPFSLYFCNVAIDCRVMHFLKKRNPFFATDLPVTSSNASYLDLFERFVGKVTWRSYGDILQINYDKPFHFVGSESSTCRLMSIRNWNIILMMFIFWVLLVSIKNPYHWRRHNMKVFVVLDCLLGFSSGSEVTELFLFMRSVQNVLGTWRKTSEGENHSSLLFLVFTENFFPCPLRLLKPYSRKRILGTGFMFGS